MSETTIYQVYSANDYKKEIPSVKINFLEGLSVEAIKPVAAKKPFTLKLAGILASIGALVLFIYFLPNLLSLANFSLSRSEVGKLSEESETAITRSLPAFDSTLSKINHVIIPSIGVDTDIEEATYDNYESALKEGVWRVSNFGQPDTVGAPVILAAHRYGYLAWTNTFRHKSSFYNLPKVKVGDTIEIDWEQRKYTYGVYKVETGTAITDYSADIILYTCESLSGEERIFVYAKLI